MIAFVYFIVFSFFLGLMSTEFSGIQLFLKQRILVAALVLASVDSTCYITNLFPMNLITSKKIVLTQKVFVTEFSLSWMLFCLFGVQVGIWVSKDQSSLVTEFESANFEGRRDC